jgi:hypothetical protein
VVALKCVRDDLSESGFGDQRESPAILSLSDVMGTRHPTALFISQQKIYVAVTLKSQWNCILPVKDDVFVFTNLTSKRVYLKALRETLSEETRLNHCSALILQPRGFARICAVSFYQTE